MSYFKVEAAGLINSFPYLVVRGIYDYIDTYKNKWWLSSITVVAVIYIKEILSIIPPPVISNLGRLENCKLNI